jgi:hypothetical protein
MSAAEKAAGPTTPQDPENPATELPLAKELTQATHMTNEVMCTLTCIQDTLRNAEDHQEWNEDAARAMVALHNVLLRFEQAQMILDDLLMSVHAGIPAQFGKNKVVQP